MRSLLIQRSMMVVAVAAMIAMAGCSRTSLNPPCPNGYAYDDRLAKCVCSSDEGCPTGYSCEAKECVCRDSSCCPSGYEYSTAGESCVCRASSCCPKDHRWLAAELKCVCGDENCCPDGYQFNTRTQSCECAGDACCPIGHTFKVKPDAGVPGTCQCAADSCCPVDYRFDPISKECVCSTSACCPPNYVYDPAFSACVCTGDTCCPAGFKKASDRSNRCVCVSNASCGANQVCDPVSGGCRCTSSAGCPLGNFCNSLGFCQSFASCASNLDCPTGLFCDTTTSRCIAKGPCTLDEHCAFNSICNSATQSCRAGCRQDGDCAPKDSCVNGACTFFCRDSQACPAGQFCNKSSGTCFTKPNRVDCNDCGGFNSCGDQAVARCLSFITEGQSATFCGMVCKNDDDCPAGFDCGGAIYSCPSGSGCEAVQGDTITCKSYDVENEVGPQQYCTDSSNQPHVYFRSCAPRSGFCPAIAPP